MLINPEADTELKMFIIRHAIGIEEAGGNSYLHSFVPSFAVPGPAIIKLQADGGSADTDVSGGFDGVLAQDALMDRQHG